MDSNTVAGAVRYRLELGLGTFPVNGATKTPRFKGWQFGGLRSEESILKVFGRYADDAIIGIATGQRIEGGYLYVLDVDERNGGLEALQALPDLPLTVTAKTKDGWHYWFRTDLPQPTIYRPDGLELKGAGAYTAVPPAPDRSWLRDPFEFEIAPCPDWLLPQPDSVTARHTPLEVTLDPTTGEVFLDLSDPLARIRSARPGGRRRTLLQQAGRVKYRTDRGQGDAETAKTALLDAALSAGVEYSEAQRVIAWVFSRPTSNNVALSSSGGKDAECINTIVTRVTERDLAVLGAVCAKFEEASLHTGRPFERLGATGFSLRWLGERCDLKHPEMVRRCLSALEAAGLVWRHPEAIRLKEGQRAMHRYRPTYAGLSLGGAA